MMLNHKDMIREVFLLPIPAEQLLTNLRLLENAYTLELEKFSISNILCSNAFSQWLRAWVIKNFSVCKENKNINTRSKP